MDVRRTINALKDVNIAKMFTTIARLLHFRLTWTRRDLDYLPAGLGPKFVSARRAAAMIPDGATLTHRRFCRNRTRLHLLLGLARRI